MASNQGFLSLNHFRVSSGIRAGSLRDRSEIHVTGCCRSSNALHGIFQDSVRGKAQLRDSSGGNQGYLWMFWDLCNYMKMYAASFQVSGYLETRNFYRISSGSFEGHEILYHNLSN